MTCQGRSHPVFKIWRRLHRQYHKGRHIRSQHQSGTQAGTSSDELFCCTPETSDARAFRH
eukprot:5776563-Amphidinium_carterae.1